MQVGSIKSMLGLVLGLVVSLLITSVGISKAKPAGGPTAENALAAEQEIARAMASNDADGITHSLADDWAVIATSGAVAEGKSVFADGIKSGFLTRKNIRNFGTQSASLRRCRAGDDEGSNLGHVAG